MSGGGSTGFFVDDAALLVTGGRFDLLAKSTATASSYADRYLTLTNKVVGADAGVLYLGLSAEMDSARREVAAVLKRLGEICQGSANELRKTATAQGSPCDQYQ